MRRDTPRLYTMFVRFFLETWWCRKYEIISSLLPCLCTRNKNEDLRRIKVGAQTNEQTKPNDCLLFVIFYYFCAVKEYATSQVASLLPHFGYRFTHALKTIPVHCRQTFQREALQIDLCCLNRLMPQQLTDNLDRYILFLQERGEWMTDRIWGDRKRNACRSRQQLQVTVKAGQGPVIFFVGRLTGSPSTQKRK